MQHQTYSDTHVNIVDNLELIELTCPSREFGRGSYLFSALA